MTNKNIEASSTWANILKDEFEKEYMLSIKEFLAQERLSKKIYPPSRDVLAAFNYCKFENVKVIILGQDPYHTPGKAHGLAFSVPIGQSIPPSLHNIFIELENDLNIVMKSPQIGSLISWAEQGVFLLNTALTVEDGKALSHSKIGWTTFTDSVITELSNRKTNLVFLLWGAHAQSKIPLIDTEKHLVLRAPHPSPLSAHKGFFGCNHFSKTNVYLIEHNIAPIDWSLGNKD